MKKLFFLTALATVFALSASAQSRVSFGIRAGLNLDHQLFVNSGITTLPDNQLGFHVGAVSDIRLFADLYLEPVLMFTTKGSSTTQTGVGTSRDRMYYLELPLMLMYYFPVIPDALGLSIHVGPMAALSLWGNHVDANGNKTAAFSDNHLQRFDTGVRFGGGLEFHQVYLGLSYDVGLYDLSPNNTSYKLHNRTLMISMGYNF